MKTTNILLGHGSGGKLSHDLIDSLFARYFKNEILDQQSDSAIININSNNIAYTTDSYVVDPLFFPGGNIGNLAIAGTVNDLSVSGAKPMYISCGFIIEEGFSYDDLEKIVISMAEDAKKAGVKIVTGDTKVVDKGKCDKVFINTSGIGIIDNAQLDISSGKNIKPSDKIIINGSIGDHGMAIMAARNDLNITTHIASDTACLNKMIAEVVKTSSEIKFMRDATRGGLGTVLSELVSKGEFGIQIEEDDIMIRESVRGLCELLGIDPLYSANEGKVVIVVDQHDADSVLKVMQQFPEGKNAAIIGSIIEDHSGMAWLNTTVGGKRVIDMLSGQQLPRIC